MQYKILQHNDLTKRGGDRIKVFLSKIKDSEDFATVRGLAKIDKSEYDRLSKDMFKSGFSTQISAKIHGSSIKLNYPKDFYKSPEFGGKGAGAGTAAEDIYLTLFRKELDSVFEKENQPAIKLTIGGRVVTCLNVDKTKQTGSKAPKSDFSIIGETDKEVAWISHKAGRRALDFQQYGGLTDSAYSNMSEVTKFASDVKAMYPNGLTSGVTLYRKITDPKIIRMSVYGLNYGRSTRDNENIDEFHQGEMKLVKSGNAYTITSVHKGLNGDIPTGEYSAYFVARYTGNVAYLGIKNARVGIFPKGKIPGTAKEI